MLTENSGQAPIKISTTTRVVLRCMAVTLQALQWNMSPFAVAQKTHLVNGTLGYEAQLVNAVFTQGLKLSVNRPRPDGTNWSFPSGHASGTFASTLPVAGFST